MSQKVSQIVEVQYKIYREELFLWELPAFELSITSAADNRLHKELNKVKKGLRNVQLNSWNQCSGA
jgi:hypothetical protein